MRKPHYTWVPSPDLTAALWRVLAEMDDVDYLGASVDRLGRRAVAFATPTSEADRHVLVYAEPDTGRFLGSEEILTAAPAGSTDDEALSDLTYPAVINFTALAESRRIPRSEIPQDR